MLVAGVAGTSDFQALTPSGTSQAHAGETYTVGIIGTTALTSKLSQLTMDYKESAYSATTSSSNTVGSLAYGFGEANYFKTVGIGNSQSGIILNAPDNAATPNQWTINFQSDLQTQNIVKFAFTGTNTTLASAGPVTTATATSVATDGVATRNSLGVMDGNNVYWYPDYASGSSAASPATAGFIRGYDTVNNYVYPNLVGCQFVNSSATTCGDPSAASANPGIKQPFLFFTTRGLAIDAAGSIWTSNGSQGQISEVFGLAAPTLPLYIHNFISTKP